MSVIYIKNNVPGNFVEFDKELKNVKIGKTYEDYLKGNWVQLNDRQIQYKHNYPNSCAKEVFYLLDNPEDDIFNLDKLKQEKIEQIKDYDQSREINVFYINNIPDWWDKSKRMQVYYRLENEEKLGKTSTTLWFQDFKIITSLKNAKYFLLLLEEYAIKCLDNTNTHIENVNSFPDIISVLDYNYTTGYPEKINLNFINNA